MINDDYADGRDVSWLWDVDFHTLKGHPARVSTSGTRAADMALRLRYDEVHAVEVEADPRRRCAPRSSSVAPDATVVVFSTYTAMWALHAVLQRIGAART